ncbi:MAG: cation:proton antiporter [Planctomycetaceae bacterium]|nr:MAG: cation:proton antiporter [Planctomycetaceae bacterium]
MTEKEIGLSILTLGVFVGVVHILGYAFERLRQPRLVGEIIAGIMLGPFVLGQLSPSVFRLLFENPAAGGQNKTSVVMSFVYWLGVLLLMFISGSQVRRLLSKENRRETAWILSVGTPLPFFLVLGLGLASIIPIEPLVGTKGVKSAALLVLASAVAVTSIPVISRIFHDLKILHTRFASLILGTAVLEDIALWGVLAVATALTKAASLSDQSFLATTTLHVASTTIFMGAALTVFPRMLKRVRVMRRNMIYKSSPLAYAICVLFAYVGAAAYLDVNLVFAAFLAGFGLAGGVAGEERQYFTDALDAIHRFSFSVFIPVYFALVGYRLVFGREFSIVMFLTVLIGSSLVALVSVGLAAKLAGFQKLDILNLAITTNARGGPGIVLASVAYEAGIISAAFYTTLVLTAIVTSQAAGMWLRFVLSKGWPLLSSNPEETGLAVPGPVAVQTPAA